MKCIYRTILCLLLVALPLTAWGGSSQWSGSGPRPPVPGDWLIYSLEMSDDGSALYSGNGSGTVFSFNGPMRVMSVTKGANGSGTVSASGCGFTWSGASGGCAASDGTSLTLSAAPAINSDFIGWSGGSGVASGCSGTAPCSLTASGDGAVIANFAIKQFTVTPSPGANGSVTPNTPQSENHGDTTSFTFTADAGYHIASVSGCGGTTYSNSSHSVTSYVYSAAITSDCTVSATFARPRYNITVSSAPTTNGSWNGSIWTPTASGANLNAAELAAKLSGGNATIDATGGTANEPGDITIAAPISWSGNNFAVRANGSILINDVMAATGSASLALNSGAGGVIRTRQGLGGFVGKVNFSGSGSLTINNELYTVITSLGSQNSTTGLDLQGIGGALSGNYALGADIDASGTASWDDGGSNLGFLPIGGIATPFIGVLDGLGHVVSALKVNRPDTDNCGLIGAAGAGAVLRNIGIASQQVTCRNSTGALVGQLAAGGSLDNDFVKEVGWVAGNSAVGGLVGNSSGAISNSYGWTSVYGALDAGGLVGVNDAGATVNGSFTFGGAVYGVTSAGGLVGTNKGSLTDVYASAYLSSYNSSETDRFGGLVGSNNGGLIDKAYATGFQYGCASNCGGLVASNSNNGTATNSFWDTESTGILTSALGTGKSTTEMKTAATYTDANWSIADSGGSSATWRIYKGGVLPWQDYPGYPGESYPLLRSFLLPVTATANNDARPTGSSDLPYSGGNGVSYSPAEYDYGSFMYVSGYSGTSQGASAAGSYSIDPLFSVDQFGGDITPISGTLTIAADVRTMTVNLDANCGNYDIRINGSSLDFGGGTTTAYFANNSPVTVIGITDDTCHAVLSGSGASASCSVAACSFVMSSNATVNVSFILNSYTVAYSGNGATSGSAPLDSTNYTNGNSVIVLGNSGALTKTGYTFAGWNSAANGSGTTYQGGDSFTIGASDVTLYARWIPKPALTVTLAGSGSGTVTGSNDSGTNYSCTSLACPQMYFNSGESVTLTATPASNNSFTSWNFDNGSIVSNITPYTGLLMNGNRSVVATFAPDAAKVKIDNNSTPYYTIDAALAAATSAAPLPRELRAQNDTLTVFSENIIMINPITILLKGGYDAGLTNQSSTIYTTIIGSLRIRGGKLIVERLKIKGL